MQKYREDSSYEDIFDKAQEAYGEEELHTPRIASRMTKGANLPNKSPFEYFQRAIFLPHLDTVLSQL